MTEITVSGYAGSTYVRTVRMLLIEKGVANVELSLFGDQRRPNLLTRHASGMMPDVSIDGFCIKEIRAAVRYLDTILPGKKLVPADPKDAARMDTVLAFSDSFLYRPMVIGVAARYASFNSVDDSREDSFNQSLIFSKIYLKHLAKRIKGSSPWLAGNELSIADLYVAPVCSCVSRTPHKDEILGKPEIREWWENVSALPSYIATEPSSRL